MDEEKEAARGFRVTDRRRFAGEGTAPPPGDSPNEPAPAGTGPAAGAAGASAGAGEDPVTFSTFILGLSTQALVALGEIEHPATRAKERDLTVARQLIDILGVLREKTRNNLQPDEDGLLESALYDLRVRYVQIMRGGTD